MEGLLGYSHDNKHDFVNKSNHGNHAGFWSKDNNIV